MELLLTSPTVKPPDGDVTQHYGNSGFLTLLPCYYQSDFILIGLFTVDADHFLDAEQT